MTEYIKAEAQELTKGSSTKGGCGGHDTELQIAPGFSIAVRLCSERLSIEILCGTVVGKHCIAPDEQVKSLHGSLCSQSMNV